MNRIIKRWVIVDPKSKAFWKYNDHYGYTTDNMQVFDVKFTDNLSEATMLSKKKAEDILEKFNNEHYVSTGYIRASGENLVIAPVTISFELGKINVS